MRRINSGFYYEIYHTGEIICNGDIEKAKEVSFIYYDKNGGKHDLGIWTLIKVPIYEKGIKLMPSNEEKSSYVTRYSDVYGCDLHYKKEGMKKMINFMEKAKNNIAIDYKKGDVRKK